MKPQILILILSFFYSNVNAQIGVNTSSPSQALDVNGQIQVGEDATADDEAGTIRYNSANQDFEGYNGSRWNSFTSQSSSSLPQGAIPVVGFRTALAVGASNNISFREVASGTAFTTIPSDKYLLITSIFVPSNNLATDGMYFVTVIPQLGGTSFFPRRLPLRGDRKSTQHAFDPYGLLMVGRPNETINVTNQPSSDFVVNVYVRGFLVDNLTY